jgi:hypothetical protein
VISHKLFAQVAVDAGKAQNISEKNVIVFGNGPDTHALPTIECVILCACSQYCSQLQPSNGRSAAQGNGRPLRDRCAPIFERHDCPPEGNNT